ncbi:MAG: TetR/AcrR family transcriptional regulator [Actinobacteria bacterium]|nr:TetR/AcrR family transcriptional regulator [Actinomycetota bacterium]
MPDLRTQKKHATRKALVAAARHLTLQHGLDGVTVEAIADEAGVSPRTFFNYFSCKEEAIVGIEPALLSLIAEFLQQRPPEEDPITALVEVMAGHGHSDVEIAGRWLTRADLARRHPELLPQYLEGVAAMEDALTGAVAARRGEGPDDLPSRVVVAGAMAVMRATIEWWDAAGRPVPLREALHTALGHFAETVAAAVSTAGGSS